MWILLIFCAIPLFLVWIQFKWERFDKTHGLCGPSYWSILGREELLSNVDSKPENSLTTGKERLCLLDILLHSEMDAKPLTNDDIRGEVNTFM